MFPSWAVVPTACGIGTKPKFHSECKWRFVFLLYDILNNDFFLFLIPAEEMIMVFSAKVLSTLTVWNCSFFTTRNSCITTERTNIYGEFSHLQGFKSEFSLSGHQFPVLDFLHFGVFRNQFSPIFKGRWAMWRQDLSTISSNLSVWECFLFRLGVSVVNEV